MNVSVGYSNEAAAGRTEGESKEADIKGGCPAGPRSSRGESMLRLILHELRREDLSHT